MPLLSVLRFIFTLVSWLILGAALYLLWRWWDGTSVVDETGAVHRVREDWMLWLGLVFTAWSFAGRFVWRLVLAHGKDDVSPERGAGTMLKGHDGDELYVEAAGLSSGPTLVLTHGAGNDSTVWYLARHVLGQRYRLLLWDLPGLGKSKGKVDLESYAENLRIVVQSAAAPVIVVGHSMGGMTIQTLARRHPEMFGTQIVGAVLLNTTYTNPLRTMILSRLAQALRPLLELAFQLQIVLLPLSWLSAWQSYLSGSTHLVNRIAFGKGVTRTQLDHTALLSARNSPATQARGNLAMFRWDATGAVAQLNDPLLIVAGDGDIVTKPEASETIAGTALSPLLHVVPHCNHYSFLDHAPEYHHLIASYVDQCWTRAGQLHLSTSIGQ